MPNPSRLVLALAAALTGLAPRAEAAWLNLGAPTEVAPGWTRIPGRYEGGGTDPVFRPIARCAGTGTDSHVLDGIVHVAKAGSAVWVDLPGTPERLAPATTACAVPQVSVEMLVDGVVVAGAPVARPGVVASAPPHLLVVPPAPARRASRFRLEGQKYGAPLGKRTEAGVEWSLDSRVSIQLNYERTAQAPMMPSDHDDGVLTRVRIGF